VPRLSHHDFTRCIVFVFTATATTDIYTLSLHDALPICNERKLSENKKVEPNKNVTDTVEEESVTTPNELTPFLSKEGLQELANYSSECCITVYMPTHRSGVEVNEQMDSIAFKNALQQIEGKLKEKGYDQAKIARILKPGYELLRNDKFWYALTEGLAFYIADGHFKYIKLLS